MSTRTTLGLIGIMARHAPLLATLEPTELRLIKPGGEVTRYAQSEGYLQVGSNRALLLLAEVLPLDGIDKEMLRERLRVAEQELAAAGDNVELRRNPERDKKRYEMFFSSQVASPDTACPLDQAVVRNKGASGARARRRSSVLVALVAAGAAFPTGRRMILARPVGTFACSVRVGSADNGKGWAYGVGRYHGDRVEWFRIRSFSPRPRHVFVRRDLQLRGRRLPRAEEMHWIPTSAMIVECALAGHSAGTGDEPGRAHRLHVVDGSGSARPAHGRRP